MATGTLKCVLRWPARLSGQARDLRHGAYAVLGVAQAAEPVGRNATPILQTVKSAVRR